MMTWILKKFKYLIFRAKLAVFILSLFPGYLKDSFRQRMVCLENKEKRILFTFNDFLFQENDNNGREPYHIMKAFSDGGYDVYFYRHSDFRNYYRLQLCGRLIYTIKNLKFVSRLPENTNDFIYGFDSIRPEFLCHSWKRLIYLNIRNAVTYQVGNVIPMPFGMFPLVSASGVDKHLALYRTSLRKCRILFAGNLSQVYYDSPIFKEKYPHLMTRLEAVKALTSSGLDIKLFNQAKDFVWFLKGTDYKDQLILVQTGPAFPVKPSQWLKIVGQSDFSLCLSGTDYPMCHNAIESMAVGSIPIIEYADWFDPKLEHGKNAIIYSGKNDLIAKIKAVLQMSPEEIIALREGVLYYYNSHLATGCLVRKYEANAQHLSTLMLFPRLVAESKEMADGQAFVQKFKELNEREGLL